MNNPIRVLHVVGLECGGAESRTMDIYRAIDKTRVQFDFVTHTEEESFFSPEVRRLGGRIYNLPRFTGANYFTYKQSWDNLFAQHSEYLIVHGHQTSTGFIYLRSAKKRGVPIRIAHARNSSSSDPIRSCCSRLARYYATHRFAVSRLAGINEFGLAAMKKGEVKIIPNAIQASKYAFNRDVRHRTREELGVKDEVLVGHIGRFHPQKNHGFLLSIFRAVHDIKGDTKLILVGDGPMKEGIVQQVTSLGIESSVIMTGIRSDVPDILQAMDVLLFPSLYEGLPGVVLEAQAAGLPCVISDTITDEVEITELVERMSLDDNAELWAHRVLSHYEDSSRGDTHNQIVKAGYDVEQVARWYQQFYEHRGTMEQ